MYPDFNFVLLPFQISPKQDAGFLLVATKNNFHKCVFNLDFVDLKHVTVDVGFEFDAF
jgi:hypothetical protein